MESIPISNLIDLAFDLTVDWKMLARVVGLDKEVARICHDYKRNVFEQAYRMLTTWRRRNGTQATYQALGEALAHQVVSRNDLAQKYCEIGNIGSADEEIDLTGRLKTGKVSPGDMLSMASDFGKEWVWVGRLLGLEDSMLDDISERHTQVYECTYKMLELWCKKQNANASYECLTRALLHRTVGMRDVAEKYCIEHQELETASAVSTGEGINPLNVKMKNLALGSSSANESGASVSGQSKSEAEIGNKTSSASAVSTGEGIKPLNENMKNLAVGSSSANESGASGSRSKAETEKGNKRSSVTDHDDCIKKNFITILPYRLWRELVVKLDPLRELGGDYRHLAAEMGYNVEKILYFQSRKDPTEALLTDCSYSVSAEELSNKLGAIGRCDARKLIDDWIKSQDCKCTACDN